VLCSSGSLGVDQWGQSHWVCVERETERERKRGRVRHRPSVGVEEADPGITGSPVKICARAATGGEAVEQWRRR
jgi:hypothetical protein